MKKCDKCKKEAVWFYMPGTAAYCDDCVPRDCECNLEPDNGNWDSENPADWHQPLDNRGRKYPCVEYDYCTDEYDA